jgi:hypothetical protein
MRRYRTNEENQSFSIFLPITYWFLVIPHYVHHIFLIPCLSDNSRFWDLSHLISWYSEKIHKLRESFLYNCIIFRYSGFSEILFSYLKLRLIEHIYISMIICKSGKHRNNLSKRYERDIYSDNIIYFIRKKYTNICILMGGHTRVSSESLVELECSNIHCIDNSDIMCE